LGRNYLFLDNCILYTNGIFLFQKQKHPAVILTRTFYALYALVLYDCDTQKKQKVSSEIPEINIINLKMKNRKQS
jgi:hypothetical protein